MPSYHSINDAAVCQHWAAAFAVWHSMFPSTGQILAGKKNIRRQKHLVPGLPRFCYQCVSVGCPLMGSITAWCCAVIIFHCGAEYIIFAQKCVDFDLGSGALQHSGHCDTHPLHWTPGCWITFPLHTACDPSAVGGCTVQSVQHRRREAPAVTGSSSIWHPWVFVAWLGSGLMEGWCVTIATDMWRELPKAKVDPVICSPRTSTTDVSSWVTYLHTTHLDDHLITRISS